MQSSQPTIEIRDIDKSFGEGPKALDGVSVALRPGEMVALIGASGSGKSTLLRLISGLTAADGGDTAGTITACGRPVQANGRIAPDARRTRSQIGFVFQQFNLVGRLSVLTNVMIGTLGRVSSWRGTLGLFTRDERLKAMRALARVGMDKMARQRASTLSGGQQQRAAIARTLVQEAKVILADEPIASLDPAAAKRVMENLVRINREDGITVLVTLHQVDYAIRYCPRTVALRAGRVVYDGPSEALTPDMLHELYGAESDELLLHPVGKSEPAPVIERPPQGEPDLAPALASA